MSTDTNIALPPITLVKGLLTMGGTVVLVSGEVGSGIVPDNTLARAPIPCARRLLA